MQTSGRVPTHLPQPVLTHPVTPLVSLFMAAAVALKDVIFYSILKPWLGEYPRVAGGGHPWGPGNGATLALYCDCCTRGWAPGECW